MAKSKYYIKKVDLYNEVVKYKASRAENPDAVMHQELAKMIWLIAQRMGTWSRYRNYQAIDDMIMDGVEDCIKRVHNFDEVKYDNAFGYISKIIEKAFHRKIHREKKQLSIKVRSIEDFNISQRLAGQTENYDNTVEIKQSETAMKYYDYLPNNGTRIGKYGKKVKML